MTDRALPCYKAIPLFDNVPHPAHRSFAALLRSDASKDATYEDQSRVTRTPRKPYSVMQQNWNQ